MKIKGKVSDGHNQLWWVVLLLAIAVILPTICLLWFMGQAVKNDRLAVRQKLSDFYQQRLETLSTRIDELWSARINLLEQKAAGSLQSEIFSLLAGSGENGDSKICDAVIIYDNNAKLLYPVTGAGEYSDDMPEEFNAAWSAEFIDADFGRAARLYEKISDSNSEDYIRYSALMGRIRCLRKLGETERTIALCREMAYGLTPEDISPSSVSLITRARILLVELKSETESGLTLSDLKELVDSAIDYTPGDGHGFVPMPSETRVFFLRKAIELAENSPWIGQLSPEISKAKQLLSTEELAAAFLDKYDSGPESQSWDEDAAVEMVTLLRQTLDQVEAVESGWSEQLRGWTEPLKQQMSMVLDSFQARERKAGTTTFEKSALATLLELWPQNSFRRLELPQPIFAMYHSVGDKTYLLLQRPERLGSDFDSCSEVEDLGVSYRIADNVGTDAWGLENPEEEAFLQIPLGSFFPGWHAAIHFTDVDIFEKTAERQKVVYLWAGLLAIFVMIAAGTLAARVVGRQIKVNKLKNDFIATVSHELKTPLASMRVLVDTLLEGNYRNQQQVTEYLELVSKENERLTGLIDNFLTFSRMERNKQAFSMSITSPAAIAHDAAEAVKTKFSKGRCDFELSIGEVMPNIQADRDAMVTVLVNLLDNAYKYSYDEKRIELKVYTEDSSVCFCVSDNGAGMSRRSIRKIFRRFYQADRSLSRRAEGCGLGLSIAKFIVDAHKGLISVDSKLGEGTVFIVRLPACG